ncbi:MAG TPA: hypothetical protein VG982_02690, partial [Candidatus Paceibacterota bacterium]|nr:hypothetical protein [Candidatus Paceibacterota bacterium]
KRIPPAKQNKNERRWGEGRNGEVIRAVTEFVSVLVQKKFVQRLVIHHNQKLAQKVAPRAGAR